MENAGKLTKPYWDKIGKIGGEAAKEYRNRNRQSGVVKGINQRDKSGPSQAIDGHEGPQH